MRLFSLLTLLIATLSTQADSIAIANTGDIIKQDVVWSIIPYAPIHILEGEYQGHGIADEYLKDAQQLLSDYQHTNQIMTPARVWHQIALQEQLVCHPSALKTPEREGYAYFTQAGLITPAIRVLMRADMWEEKFKGQNSLNVGSYISNGSGVLGIVSQRSYGETVDAILSKTMNGTNKIVQSSGQFGSRQLYKMLLSGRIDVMLEYPWVSAYFDKVLKHDGVEVVHLTIKDFPRYSAAYVACTRNEAGRKIIQALDQFLAKEVLKLKNRQRMMRWLDDKEAKSFEKDYLEYFKIAH